MAEPGASELQPLRPGKAMTIGAVCQALSREFPDISISKLRYLEHQKLLEPRRTPGGYRLYGPADVDRLRAILRMQRDEFLPLRVIRQELAAGRAEGAGAGDEKSADARPRRMPTVGSPGHARYSLDEVLDDTRADAGLIKELQEFGVVQATDRGRRAVLRRHRPGDRSRRRRAGPIRRRGPQSPRLPHLGRP
ncbi:MAG: MerR family transcriptional regulator [Baekduia sp.]